MPTNKELTKQFQQSVNRLKALQPAQASCNIFTSYRPPKQISAQLEEQYSALASASIRPVLAGKLCAIKDNITTTQEPTTCASQTLAAYTSPFESTVTSLLTAAGASVVGKTNMDEFGMGAATTHSYFGATRNPRDPERIVGGSSGGSAAAVAAGVCDFALGTDTGGSVRNPATHSGIVGFKPSYGRLSRWGVIPYAQSFDTVGVLAADVSTVQTVYQVLNQYDEKDVTSLDADSRQRVDVLVGQRTGPLVIGIPMEFNVAELSPEIRRVWGSILARLLERGHTIKPVSLPSVKVSLPAYYTLALSEAASNLSKFDGVRYGYRDPETDTAKGDDTLFAATRAALFGSEVKRRILLGNYNLSSDGYKNNFLKALRIRQQLSREFNEVFRLPNVLADASPAAEGTAGLGNPEGVDVLLTPTQAEETPTLAAYRKRLGESPVQGYINDVLTVPASLAGLPSISVPVAGEVMPFGFLITGQFGDDAGVLEMGQLVLEIDL